MNKIGILTFHYSNNYGGVLQALALQKVLQSRGYNVEIINYIPSRYNPSKITNSLGLKKNLFENRLKDINIIDIVKKISIVRKYSQDITNKFDTFRKKEMNLSTQVDENSIETILNNYNIIIVGSDQIWNPSQRKKPEYFLNFASYNGKKISYAADSTIKEVDIEDKDNLVKALNDFCYISVRNKHSFEFVKSIIQKEPVIVADPVILYDFNNRHEINNQGEYILTYLLGKEIEGTHEKAIRKIKEVYGDLPVYSIKIPTMNFELSNFDDKVFYNLDPNEWLAMIRNSKFVYTDSFHGVLFSLKYQKPFLAYYTEKLRATRFIDLGQRYHIERYIVKNVDEIDIKDSLKVQPDFKTIKNILKQHKVYSLDFLERALRECLESREDK